MSAAPEFSRRFALAEIGTVPKHVAVAADGAECAALARRFGLASLVFAFVVLFAMSFVGAQRSGSRLSPAQSKRVVQCRRA